MKILTLPGVADIINIIKICFPIEARQSKSKYDELAAMNILKGADRRSEGFCRKLLLVLHLINARLSPVVRVESYLAC